MYVCQYPIAYGFFLQDISSQSLTFFGVDSDQPVTYINPTRKTSSPSASRSHAISTIVEPSDARKQDFHAKSSTLPVNRSKAPPLNPHHSFTRPPNLDLPGYPYRAPSPILTSGDHHAGVGGAAASGKSVSSKRSLFRRRAESVDNKIRHM